MEIALKLEQIEKIRTKLYGGVASVGTWLQIPDSNVAEILANAGYDWIGIDQEHGVQSGHKLTDIVRAIELHGVAPIVRVCESSPLQCKLALDAGGAGVILPNISSAANLRDLVLACRWPPAGARGVGFSRANMFGRYFSEYSEMAKKPIVVAMIENKEAVENINEIVEVAGVDAIFIGPYDLSASLGAPGDLNSKILGDALEQVREAAKAAGMPYGIHCVQHDPRKLEEFICHGYQFVAYSIDSSALRLAIRNPLNSQEGNTA